MRRRGRDLEKNRANTARWRGANPVQVRAAIKACQRRAQDIVKAAKARPCMDCGVQYPSYVMEFDHRDPATKSFNIGSLRRIEQTVLRNEIAKCDVVCANCHRARTYRLQEID
jgi:hypothetical protein